MIAMSHGLGRYENITNALNQLKFKTKGKTLLKPNLVTGGLAASHVDAVKAVLDTLDIDMIAEGSAVDTKELYRRLGYKKLAGEYGVELVDLNDGDEWENIEFLNIEGRTMPIRVSRFHQLNVISLTLPKTHDHAIVTLTLKNLLGFLHPEDRSKVHGYASSFGKVMRIRPVRKVASYLSRFRSLRRFYSATDVPDEKYIKGVKVIHKNIATLAKLIKPKLGIIDGYIGMQGPGPVAGGSIEWNIAIAGDPVECDAYCAYLMGFNPKEIGYLYYLNPPPLDEIKILGDIIPEKRFTPHPRISLQMKWKD